MHILFFLSLIVNAKCKDFEIIKPNFCASVSIQEIIRNKHKEYYFVADINNFSNTAGHKLIFPNIEKQLKEKSSYVFLCKGEQCKDVKIGGTYSGIIEKKCNDNLPGGVLSLTNWLLSFFDKQDIFQDFNFYNTKNIQLRAVHGSEISVSCK